MLNVSSEYPFIKFNVNQVKQKPLEVCINCCWIFGILRLSKQQKHQHTPSNPVYHQHVYIVVHCLDFSEKVLHYKLLDLVLPYT